MSLLSVVDKIQVAHYREFALTQFFIAAKRAVTDGILETGDEIETLIEQLRELTKTRVKSRESDCQRLVEFLEDHFNELPDEAILDYVAIRFEKNVKPLKPTPDWPLFPAANGQWAKCIGGERYYFGVWKFPNDAIIQYRGLLRSGELPHKTARRLIAKENRRMNNDQ